MSQTGNKCPGLNEFHTFKSGYCLRDCERQCVPASVLVHIEAKQRVDKHQGEYVSVTSLLGCLRQLYLERTIDYFVEPPLNWYSIRGTLLHNILENPDFKSRVDDMLHYLNRVALKGEVSQADAKAVMDEWVNTTLPSLMRIASIMPKTTIPDWQSEVEYEYPLGDFYGKPWFLRGTIDVLRKERGEIYDYKTIGDRGLGVIKRGAKDDHVRQFNMYRFMVERGYPVGQRESYTPVTIAKIKSFYMTMMQVVGTGSLMTEDTIYRKSEPEFESTEVGREFLDERTDMVLKKGKRMASAGPEDYEVSLKKKWRLTYAIPDVPLMPLDDVAALIHGKAPELIAAFAQGTMPEMCAPEMRAWKCAKYCPDAVRQACDAYNETVGVKRVDDVVKKSDEIPVEVL